jgi:hypothetical protein
MSRSRWLLLVGLALAFAACKAKRAPVEDNQLALERQVVGDAVGRLEGTLAEARARAAQADGRDEAVLGHEEFAKLWFLRCAMISGMIEHLRTEGEAILVDRAEHLCKVALPLADMREIVALLRAEQAADPAQPFGCMALAVNFADDYKSLGSVGKLDDDVRAMLASFKAPCGHSVTHGPISELH